MITLPSTSARPAVRSVGDIPVGQPFMGQVGNSPMDTLFLRTYSGCVQLNDPSRTWSVESPVLQYTPTTIEIREVVESPRV